jgi:hypothetical protein
MIQPPPNAHRHNGRYQEQIANRKPAPAAFRFGFGHGVQWTADVSCWATRLLLADTNDHTLSGTVPQNTGLPKNQVLDGQNVLANLATGRRSAINILCGNDCLFSFARRTTSPLRLPGCGTVGGMSTRQLNPARSSSPSPTKFWSRSMSECR